MSISNGSRPCTGNFIHARRQGRRAAPKLSGVGGSAPTYQVSIDRPTVIEYPASTLMTQLFS